MNSVAPLLWTSLPSLESFSRMVTSDLLSIHLDHRLLTEPNDVEVPQAWLHWINAWSHLLEASPGLAVIQTDPACSDEQLRLQYAVIARALGQLNDRYGFFFDVKDQGLDYTKSPIPVSKTNAETSFHTDSTAKNYYPDIVGLLCIHPASEGGDSLITNAAGAYEHLRSHFPDALHAISQPLFRDVITPGSTYDEEAIRNNAFPIFQFDEQGLHFRYMRYWVERAYEKLRLSLTPEIMQGMDAIDDYFQEPGHRIQFRMDRGDMLFVNNRFLCHNRTAFSSSVPPRTLVRTWING